MRPGCSTPLNRPAAVLKQCRLARSRPTARNKLPAHSLPAAVLRETLWRHRECPSSPVTSMYWHTANGSHNRSSEHRLRTPAPEGRCHQCCTSPSVNCRDAARKISSRAIPAPRSRAEPAHPATGLENHTRRSIDTTRNVPKCGSSALDRAASDSTGNQPKEPAS